MDKLESLDRVLGGEEVAKPPLTLWDHFGVQPSGGEQFGRISLEYFNYYDYDFLKVMNDYFDDVLDFSVDIFNWWDRSPISNGARSRLEAAPPI